MNSGITNAHINRMAGLKMYSAGMTAAQIASEFSRYFGCNEFGQLSIRYSREATRALHLADRDAKELGIKECDGVVTQTAVKKAIAKHGRKGGAK